MRFAHRLRLPHNVLEERTGKRVVSRAGRGLVSIQMREIPWSISGNCCIGGIARTIDNPTVDTFSSEFVLPSKPRSVNRDPSNRRSVPWRLHMRQLFLVLSLLLLGMTWAAAQDSSTPSTGSQSGAGSDSSAVAAGSGQQSAAGGQMMVEGCLSGSSGNFTLTDKNGTSYQLTGDTAKLSEHVGHEVKITGTSSSGGSDSSSASTGAGAPSTLHVSSVKHISKTCKSDGMAH